MKIDLTLKLVLKYFDKEIKKINNFDYKLKNGTWNEYDLLVIKDLQYKSEGFEKLDNLIKLTSTGNEFLNNELKLIKTLLR